MYCPNCGLETTGDRKFCRACGLDLHTVTQALSGNMQGLQTGELESANVSYVTSDRQKFMRAGFLTMWSGFLVAACLGILGGAFTNIDNDLGAFVASLAGIGGLVVLLGIGLMIYSRFFPKAPAQIKPDKRAAMPGEQQYIKLQPGYEPRAISSVTDHTTELLDSNEPGSRARDVRPRSE